LKAIVYTRYCGKRKIEIVSLKTNKDLVYLNELFEAGKIKSIMDGPFKLADVPDAFRHFEMAEHKGKIVISIS
jgi:NADPH:quinone reductase-like Zn-dependent oxidoreductase